MPFCAHCGMEVPPGATFCPSCGAPMRPVPSSAPPPSPAVGPVPPPPSYPPPPPVTYPPVPPPYAAYKTKSVGIAVLLSVLISGIGQMYVGQVKRGVAILILGFVVVFIAYYLGFSLISLVYWGWNVYDAYSLAKRYNGELARTGRPPW